MRRHGTSAIALSVLGVTALLLFGFLTRSQWDGGATQIVSSVFDALYSALQKIVTDPMVLVMAPVSWLQKHFMHAPTLVLGLFTLLLVPALSVFFGVVRMLRGTTEKQLSCGTRGMRHRGKSQKTDRRRQHQSEDCVPRHAVLEVAEGLGAQGIRVVKISRPVVQIGRSDDVDIKLNDAAVHRYHAAIERSDCSGYLIVDLSAGTGNGVVVNGRPALNHTLHDGDEIRIGHTKLRFATALS